MRGFILFKHVPESHWGERILVVQWFAAQRLVPEPATRAVAVPLAVACKLDIIRTTSVVRTVSLAYPMATLPLLVIMSALSYIGLSSQPTDSGGQQRVLKSPSPQSPRPC